MLNKPLYDVLVRMFKRVEIANEGQHARVSRKAGTVSAWCIEKNNEHGEQYRVNCPFCDDKHKHLYISYLSYIRPVINGQILQVGKLRAQCFRRGCLKKVENREWLEGQIAMYRLALGAGAEIPNIEITEDSQETMPKYEVSEDISVDGFRTWVPDFEPITEKSRNDILEYLQSRRVTMDDVNWLHLGWGPVKSPRSGNYLNNGSPFILIPFIQNNQVKGIQGRCLPQYLKDDGIKYWIHPACRKRTVILNIDVARQLGLGVVCEGAFDVLSIGKPGVCTFGHTPSETQRRLLSTFSQGLIWCPDTDVTPKLNPIKIAREHVTVWNEANVFPRGAHVVELSQKDAGSLSRQQVWEEIVAQVPAQMQEFLLERIIPNL